MTIQELINKLQQHDPNLPVVIRGSEGGIKDVTEVCRVTIALNVHTEWYYGSHEAIHADYSQELYKNYKQVKAIQIV